MSTDTDIWFAFARTFGMLFVVLAVFLLAFYLFRRFSGVTGGKGSRNLIQVLAVHHLAPKEKLVLVSVLKENILIGVTPQGISKLAVLGNDPMDNDSDLEVIPQKTGAGFSDLLNRTLSRGTANAETPDREKD